MQSAKSSYSLIQPWLNKSTSLHTSPEAWIWYTDNLTLTRCEVSVEKSFYTLSNEKNVTVVGEWKCLLDQTGSQYTLMSCIFEKIEIHIWMWPSSHMIWHCPRCCVPQCHHPMPQTLSCKIWACLTILSLVVPPPTAPIIIGGKDYYNEASEPWALIGQLARPSHWLHRSPVICEQNMGKHFISTKMQLKQNIKCNKDNNTVSI